MSSDGVMPFRVRLVVQSSEDFLLYLLCNLALFTQHRKREYIVRIDAFHVACSVYIEFLEAGGFEHHGFYRDPVSKQYPQIDRDLTQLVSYGFVAKFQNGNRPPEFCFDTSQVTHIKADADLKAWAVACIAAPFVSKALVTGNTNWTVLSAQNGLTLRQYVERELLKTPS